MLSSFFADIYVIETIGFYKDSRLFGLFKGNRKGRSLRILKKLQKITFVICGLSEVGVMSYRNLIAIVKVSIGHKNKDFFG